MRSAPEWRAMSRLLLLSPPVSGYEISDPARGFRLKVEAAPGGRTCVAYPRGSHRRSGMRGGALLEALVALDIDHVCARQTVLRDQCPTRHTARRRPREVTDPPHATRVGRP